MASQHITCVTKHFLIIFNFIALHTMYFWWIHLVRFPTPLRGTSVSPAQLYHWKVFSSPGIYIITALCWSTPLFQKRHSIISKPFPACPHSLLSRAVQLVLGILEEMILSFKSSSRLDEEGRWWTDEVQYRSWQGMHRPCLLPVLSILTVRSFLTNCLLVDDNWTTASQTLRILSP